MNILTSNSLTTNLKLCLDAGDINSYSGSGQKWLDRSGLGHDFFLGVDGSANTDDPTFNGSPGNASSNEYFSVDGGDFFRYDSTGESWIDAFHKDDFIGGLFAAVYVAAGASGRLCGNTGNAFNPGFDLRLGDGDSLRYIVYALPTTVVFDMTADTPPTANAWNTVGVSLNEAGGNVSFFYQNGNYNQIAGSNTFNAAYSSPSSAAANHPLEIAASGNGQSKFGSGCRVGLFAMWQGTAPTKANFDTIRNAVIATRYS